VLDLGGDANAARRLSVLRAIDKLDRLGVSGVRSLLTEGRRDESGDFTPGAGLSEVQAIFVLANIGVKVYEKLNQGDVLYAAFTDLNSKVAEAEAGRNGLDELRQLKSLITASRYEDRIRIDQSVVRGLEYYTGPVYEVDLTFDIKNEHGQPIRFGSVGGGGRYDGLIARFRGESVPATGFSIGVSRLAAALQHLGKIVGTPELGPVVVTVFDQQRIVDYQNMVAQLRKAGIRAEPYLGYGKMGAQLKYADKRGAPCVVIQGDDEKARGEVQIKDLVEGAKAAAEIASHEEWCERRPAQFAVAENRLVEAVRGVLHPDD